VPIDRVETLKKAEKLLRQGKLDGAIAEYVRLVEDQPKDWNSINALGDLYVRAGQPDKAVAQFTRVADYLIAEGFFPKAAALYKKILKFKADDEHTILQLAELAAKQGVMVDAKAYFRQVGEQRKKARNERGWAEIMFRIAALDPADGESKVVAARAAQAINDIPKAVSLLQDAADAYEKAKRVPDVLAALAEALALDPSDAALRARLLNGLIGSGDIEKARAVAQTSQELVTIADVLEQRGRTPDALDVLAEATRRDPEDAALRTRLLRGLLAAGNFEQARTVARTSEELIRIAEVLDQGGRKPEALKVLTEAAQLDPQNLPLRARLARECMAAGNIDQARTFLTREVAGDDTDLLLLLARMELTGGRIDEGKSALNRLLAVDPKRREELVVVANELAEQKLVEAAFACADLVADAALLEEDWAAAAAALHEFVTRVPNQVGALMKLVEICVDGGLESTMYEAQAQLADAYLASGLGAEARVIAEDLVAREPWVRANIDRFRRALIMLNVPDPDALIAERLSGDSPFTSTIDVTGPGGQARPAPPPRPAPAPPPEPLPEFSLDIEMPPPPPPAARVPAPPSDEGFEAEMSEIDLSTALTGLNPAAPAGGAKAPEIEDAFDGMRAHADRQTQTAHAEAQFEAGLSHMKYGRIPEAFAAFEMAAKVPSLRFRAAGQLGRLHIGRGDLEHAVEWLERAAEAPAPTPEEGHALMYDLADALEQQGESARALAVLMELELDSGGYRDVTSRIERLSRVQTGS
jgi:tetratricopeptide (TPR) repeat protein